MLPPWEDARHWSARMTGFRLMLQDDKGEYTNIIFVGSMLVYDPQHDIIQWVPVWGMSAALTMMELRVANDLCNMVPLPSLQSRPGEATISLKSSKVYWQGPRVIQTAQ